MAATSLTCMNLLHLAVTFKVLTLSGSFGSDGGGGGGGWRLSLFIDRDKVWA